MTKEERAEYMKKYREEHKEELKANRKYYYEHHKEEMAKYHKEYRATHREQYNEYHRQWHNKNRDKHNAYLRERYQRKKIAEYIEKEPLLRKAKELQGGSFSSPLIVEAIEKAPAIEIVRCRDCKYFREYTTEYLREVEKADGDCYIRRMNSDNEQFVACCRNDFCSYGERREDETV